MNDEREQTMKAINPGNYDIHGVRFAVVVIRSMIDDKTGSQFSENFQKGARDLIRLATDVMEDAWKGEGVKDSEIEFYRGKPGIK